MLSAEYSIQAPNIPHYLLYRATELWPQAVILQGVEQFGVRSKYKPLSGYIRISEYDIYIGNLMRAERPYIKYSCGDNLVIEEFTAADMFKHLTETLDILA